MTSKDPWQVSTAIVRLRRAAEVVNPAHSFPEILRAVAEVAAILRRPPGDPDGVEAQAAAFHALAADLAATGVETGHIATATLPEIWQGEAATAATASLKATRDLIETASAGMRAAGNLLDDHAETLRRLHKELENHRRDLTGFRALSTAFLAVRGALSVFERLQRANDTLRQGMRAIETRAQAATLPLPASDAVRLTNTGILTAIQLKRAAAHLDALSTNDAERMRALLAAAATQSEKAYLLKALAAGHSLDAIEAFAAAIHGQDEYWLDRHLNPRAIRQFDETACGSTTIMMARALADPIYAWSLDSEERIRAEEQRIHDSTNGMWPQRLGTTPWGLTGELNRYGTQYDWRAVDDTVAGSVESALDAAVGAVDAGHSVPVLIGDGYPRHYVLLIGHEGGELVFYNPSGELTRLREADFRDGNMSALGYRHVQGVVTPR